MGEKRKVGGAGPAQSATCPVGTGIQTAWEWRVEVYTDRWDREENPEVDADKRAQVTFYRESTGKILFSTAGAGTVRQPLAKRQT